MIDITFPDGSVKSFESGVTCYEIAKGISPKLAAEVLAATVVTKDDATGKGTVYDLDRPVCSDAAVRLHNGRMPRLSMCSGILLLTCLQRLWRLYTLESNSV